VKSSTTPLGHLVAEIRGHGLEAWLDEPFRERFPDWHGRAIAMRLFRQGTRFTLREFLAVPVRQHSWMLDSFEDELARHIAEERARRESGFPAPGQPGWQAALDARGVGWLGLRRFTPGVTVGEYLSTGFPASYTRKREEQRATAADVANQVALISRPIAAPAPRSALGQRVAAMWADLARECRSAPVDGARITPSSDAVALEVHLAMRDCSGAHGARATVHFRGGDIGVDSCGHAHPCGVRTEALREVATWLDSKPGSAFERQQSRPAWENALEALRALGQGTGHLTAVVTLAGKGGVQLVDAQGKPQYSLWAAPYGSPERTLVEPGDFSRKLAVLASFPRVRCGDRPVRVAVWPLGLCVRRSGDAAQVRLTAGAWSGTGRELAAFPSYSGMTLIPSEPGLLAFTAASAVPDLVRGWSELDFPAAQIGDLLRGLEHLGIPVSRPAGLAGVTRRWAPALTADLSFEPGAGLVGHLRIRSWDGAALVAGAGEERPLVELDGVLTEIERDFGAERAAVADLAAALGVGLGEVAEAPDGFALHALPDAVAVVKRLEARDDVAIRWRKRLAVQSLGPAQVRVALRPVGAWFEVSGEIQGGGPSLAEILGAIRDRKTLVQVAPGQVIELAAPLFESLGHLADVIDLHQGALRVGRVHQRQLADDLGQRLLSAPADFREPVDVEPPPSLLAELRPYQREGLRFLVRRASWSPGALLADDMGLGKTVQAIALLCMRPGPALVVAPTSVTGNWLAELARFAPHLTIVDHRGASRNREHAPAPGEIVLTTWDTLVRDEDLLAPIEWDTLVLDEAHAVKNARTRRAGAASGLSARFRVALTGTPVENRLSELWSLLGVVVPGLLPREDLFRARFQVPIERDHDDAALTRLRAIVHPFLLRRTKAEVAAFLPPKTEVVERVALPPAEAGLYAKIRTAAVRELAGGTGPQARFRVLAAITRLRQVACDARLVEPSRTTHGPKVRRLVELLSELGSEGVRTLVFSEFTSLLDLCEPALEAAGLSFLRLDGSTTPGERVRRVAAFQAGEAPVFLLSRKAGGTGLNLTAASAVIHLDPWWNPAVEDQATDRVHRLGQERPVTVIRLVTEGTLEERVLSLHAEKRALVAGVLDGASASKLLDAGELLALLGDDAPVATVTASKAPARRPTPPALARSNARTVQAVARQAREKLATTNGLAPSTRAVYLQAVDRFTDWLDGLPPDVDLRSAISAFADEVGASRVARSALSKLLRYSY
jgi:superfamily II DNA or RNA helicase